MRRCLFAVPTEFTRIPFAAKALKLILQEMQSNGEPASMGYGGLNSSDVREIGSDDGVSRVTFSRPFTYSPSFEEEEWSDDEEVAGAGLGANEVSYLSDMLGGAVPPEMMAALRGGSFESIVSVQGDDEDLLKDPSVQIDMRVSQRSLVSLTGEKLTRSRRLISWLSCAILPQTTQAASLRLLDN